MATNRGFRNLFLATLAFIFLIAFLVFPALGGQMSVASPGWEQQASGTTNMLTGV